MGRKVPSRSTCNYASALLLIQLALREPPSGNLTNILLLISSCDVVDHLVAQNIEGPNALVWPQQLCFGWEQPTLDVSVAFHANALSSYYKVSG